MGGNIFPVKYSRGSDDNDDCRGSDDGATARIYMIRACHGRCRAGPARLWPASARVALPGRDMYNPFILASPHLCHVVACFDRLARSTPSYSGPGLAPAD